jgi:hypothetical protein
VRRRKLGTPSSATLEEELRMKGSSVSPRMFPSGEGRKPTRAIFSKSTMTSDFVARASSAMSEA